MPPTAYVFIDVQHNLLDDPSFPYSKPTCLAQWTKILESARSSPSKPLVYHVQHDGPVGDVDEPFTPGWELAIKPLDSEPVFRKTGFSVWESNPTLANLLRDQGVKKLVLAGMQSENCVRAASLGGVKEGFEIVVLGEGAHRTWDWDEKKAGEIEKGVEEELKQNGVKVVAFGDGFQW